MKRFVHLGIGKIITSFAIFLVIGLALVWPSLHYPMAYDDLHLIRPFSGQQILSSFHGNYDPDGFENAGLRPFMVLFNHTRYQLFGEDVVAHRLFLILLCATYLTSVCWIAFKFGLSWSWATVAGVLCLCAKYNVSHYLWLTDGIHLFQGLLFTLSVIALFNALASPRWWMSVVSLGLLSVGLLTREDTLAVVPIVVILGYSYTRTEKYAHQMIRLSIFTGILVVLCLADFIGRAVLVPEAQSPAGNLVGMAIHAVLMFTVVGLKYFDWASQALVYGWYVAVVILVATYLARRPHTLRDVPTMWLVCAALACAPGLSVVRINLLLFPITFVTLFFVSTLASLPKSSPFKLIGVVVLIWGIVGGIYVSLVTAQSFHPDSATAISWNGQFIYGEFAARATIPPERREKVVKQLAAVHIESADDFQVRFPQMVEQAVMENRRSPDSGGTFFVPRLQAIFEP